MAFNPQQISPIDFNKSAAVGIDLPFNGNAVFKSNFQTKDAIKNNLINFFLTNPGDRYLNPTFGGGLREFIFEQLSNDNITFLQSDIEQKIQQFFPNIIVTSLNIFENADFNSINIELKYEVANTNITDIINIEF
jgi:phage baseplate assembly protein W|tara:strand:- start:240 stop:644 length:405 start_codon:yes stop_codon:yes gene_type:complete